MNQDSDELLFARGDAISDFTEAIEIDRCNADYYWWRGKIYYESEQYQNSIDDYNSTVKQKPDNGGYYYWKTKIYGKLGDIDRKREAICKAIECNTAYPSYHYYLGVLYYNEDDYDNAIAEFKVSVDNAPDDA